MNGPKLLLNSFHSWRVCHAKRSRNETAHRLAKVTLSHGMDLSWRGNIPIYIREIVLAKQDTS